MHPNIELAEKRATIDSFEKKSRQCLERLSITIKFTINCGNMLPAINHRKLPLFLLLNAILKEEKRDNVRRKAQEHEAVINFNMFPKKLLLTPPPHESLRIASCQIHDLLSTYYKSPQCYFKFCT